MKKHELRITVMQKYNEKSTSYDESKKSFGKNEKWSLKFFFWAGEHKLVSGVKYK